MIYSGKRGGAGYIGSHTCIELMNAGYGNSWWRTTCTIRARRPCAAWSRSAGGKRVPFVQRGPVRRRGGGRAVPPRTRSIEAVIQFAAYKAVGESVAKAAGILPQQPRRHADPVLSVMRKHGVKNIVFSALPRRFTAIRQRCPIARRAAPRARSPTPTARPRCMIEQILTRPAQADPDMERGAAALLQPHRRARKRPHRRGPQGHPQQPAALHRPGGRGQAARAARVRQRLPHPGRHRRARLHPCGGPGHAAMWRPLNKLSSKAGCQHVQPGHRQRLQRAGRDARLCQGLAARSCPTSSTRAARGDIAECYADPAKARDELGWKAAVRH